MQRISKVTDLDAAFVKGLRRDFLILMKNVNKGTIDTGKNLHDFKRSLKHWWDNQSELFIQINKELRNVRGSKRRVNQAKRFMIDIHIFGEFIQTTGTFVDTELSDAITSAYRRGVDVDINITSPEFTKSMVKWANSSKRKARLAWKYLLELVDWVQQADGENGGVSIDDKSSEIINLEGFQTEIISFDDRKGSKNHDQILYLRAALKSYRKKALSVLPWLIRHRLPMRLDFNSNMGQTEASYHGKFIQVSKHALSRSSLGEFVMTIAHEMGHHVYGSYLSKDQKDFWTKAVTGDYKRLDLRDVLEAHEDLDSNAFKKNHPILHLQMQALYFSSESRRLYSKEHIERFLRQGNHHIVYVPANPITGYANKNPEEAFCEALGLLVAYGPKALLGPIKEFMHTILPDVRISSRRSSSQIFELSQRI